MSNAGNNKFLIKCPKCSKQLRVSPQVAGKRITCPACSQTVKVPGVAASQPTESDWLQLDLDQDTPRPPEPQQAESTGRRQATSVNSTASSSSTVSAQPNSTKLNSRGPVARKTAETRTAARGEPKEQTSANKAAPPTPVTPAASNSSAGPARSLFDDDLPELAALETPQTNFDSHGLMGVESLENRQAPVPPVVPKSSSSRPTTKQIKPTANQAQYRVGCLICGTPQYVTLAQQGRKVRCPDCHSEFRVPAPPPNWKPNDNASPMSFSTNLAEQSQSDIDSQEARARETANDYLRQAQTELSDDDLDSLYQGDFDTHTFVRRTFGFCFDNMALVQLVVFSVSFAVIGSVFQWAHQTALAGDKGYFLISALAMPICQLLVACPLFAAAMALLESLANDQPRVGNWPGANFFEQIGELLVFAAALFLAALPGVLLGLLLGRSGVGNWLVLMGGMFSALLLFPVTLLGMLDNGSIFNPISSNVLRSLTGGAESWGAYYMKTAIAFFAVFIVLTIFSSGPALLAGIGWATMPWLIFFTSQQLGILASDINQHLTLQFSDDPDHAAEDDGTEA